MKKQAQEDKRIHDIWIVSEIDGTRLEAAAGTYPIPTIEFQESTGQVSGNTGCNQYFGKYFIKGDTLIMKNLGMTKMACPGPNYESAFLQIINAEMTYQIREMSLLIFVGGELKLRCKKVD